MEDDKITKGKKPKVGIWDTRIQKAEKYMQPAWTHGQAVYGRYQDKRDGTLGSDSNIKRANIFYANVNTLKESLFNSLPKADVSLVHKGDSDDVGRVSALIMQRGLDYEIQCADDFKCAVRGAILDRLVPGIGQVWIRFEMETDEQGAPLAGTEQIFVDQVYWEDFLYEPARNWASVKWAGRKLDLTKAEIIERWGEEAMSKVQMDKSDATDLTPKQITENKYLVYEIWDKVKRQVHWVCKGADAPLESIDDPYQLKDFFPCPPPLIANCTTTAYLPVTDYHIAQDQYNQLDVLYARIGMIITAIKVAGLYDAQSTEIGRMLEGQENKLIPVENWAMFVERGGAGGGIQWYPVEQVVTVLQQLQAQYEAVKATLQEISGMADIIRGSSNQYETAAAQTIKAQFASVRMNGYQRDVAEFVTGIINIMGEMMVQLYSDEKLQKIVGQLNPADLPFIPQALEVLRNDQLAMYKISVQADSLVQADWALEKGQRMELMGYVSQFLQSSVPAIQQNPNMAPLLLTMFKFTIAGYRGGAEIEGALNRELEQMAKQAQEAAAQPPQPPPPSPEEIKAQAEAQRMQQEFQLKQQESMMQAQLEQQAQEGRMAIEREQAAMDAEVARQKMEHDAVLQAQKLEGEKQAQLLELSYLSEKYRMELEYKERELGVKTQHAAVLAQIKQDSAAAPAEKKEPKESSEKESGQKEAMETVLELTRALTAPKRIIKDAMGNPIGIERVGYDLPDKINTNSEGEIEGTE